MLGLSITQDGEKNGSSSKVEEQRQEEDQEQCERVSKLESSRRMMVDIMAHLLPHSPLWRFLGQILFRAEVARFWPLY